MDCVSEIISVRSFRNIIWYFLIIFYSIIHIRSNSCRWNFISTTARIQYALCRRNTINQAITINGERERVVKGMGKTRTCTITQRGRALSRDGLGIGEAYIRLCSIYPWIKDNIFILVPTTILHTRSTVAYDALFIFPLRTRDKRQSTFPVANSNTPFEKIMWQKYWYSLFDAGKRQYFRVLLCKPQARIRNVYLRRLGGWVNQHIQRIFSNSYIAIAYYCFPRN